jgi:hypothetical protein
MMLLLLHCPSRCQGRPTFPQTPWHGLNLTWGIVTSPRPWPLATKLHRYGTRETPLTPGSGPQCLHRLAVAITDSSDWALSRRLRHCDMLSGLWSCRTPLAPDWLLPRLSPPFSLSTAGYLRAMLLSIVKLYQSRALLDMPFLV